MDIFNKNKQIEDAKTTVIAFNKMMIQNAERAFNLQVTSLKAYTKIYLDNCSAGLELGGMDDFNALFEQQQNMGREISDLWVADINAFGELSSRFFDDACNLADTNSIVALESPEAAAKPPKIAMSTTKTMAEPVKATMKPAWVAVKPSKAVGLAGATTEPVKAAEKPAGVAVKPSKAVGLAGATTEPVKAAEEPAGVAVKPSKAAVSPAGATTEPVKAAEEPAGVAVKPSKAAASPARTTAKPDA